MKKIGIAVAVCCFSLTGCVVGPSIGNKSTSTARGTAAAPNPGATAASSPTTKTRDWVSELVSIGYEPGAYNGKWLEERMFAEAHLYCFSSLTTPAEDLLAKVYNMTEFEFAVFEGGRGAADPAMEQGFVLKVIQRFCGNREESYDTVLRLHPELPAPKGRV